MKESIQTELDKENPNWLMISDLAKKLYLTEQQTNSLGLKKGVVNIIKSTQFNCERVLDELHKCFDSSEYVWLLVGSYKGMTVTKFNKIISTLNYQDKYVIVVTNKEQVFTNLNKAGIQCMLYNASIRNRYDKEKNRAASIPLFRIKGGDVDIKCLLTEIKSHIRDNQLNMLLD